MFDRNTSEKWFGNVWILVEDIGVIFIMMGCGTDSSSAELRLFSFYFDVCQVVRKSLVVRVNGQVHTHI